MEDWVPTLSAGPLLGIAAAAIALILVLVIVFKLHAFLTLIIVSAATGLAAGIPLEGIVPTMTKGFGSTLASVALLVGLGAMLGRLVETSGGAKSLAETLVARFGEQRAPFALGVASLLMGFPIFFDAGLIVMLPVIFAVARRLNGPVLAYGIPAAGAFSVMHIYLPPHPGPISAAEFYSADIGLVMLLGLIIAIPTWLISGLWLGKTLGRRYPLPVPDILAGGSQATDVKNPATPGLIVSLLLLPMLLIFGNTGMGLATSAGWVDKSSSLVRALQFVGSTPIALLISTLVALYFLGIRRGQPKADLEKLLDGALGPICSVVLITGAGGMFGGVLRTSGIGDALADSMSDLGVPRHPRLLARRRHPAPRPRLGHRGTDHRRSTNGTRRRGRRLQRIPNCTHGAGLRSWLRIRRPRQRLRLLARRPPHGHGRCHDPTHLDTQPSARWSRGLCIRPRLLRSQLCILTTLAEPPSCGISNLSRGVGHIKNVADFVIFQRLQRSKLRIQQRRRHKMPLAMIHTLQQHLAGPMHMHKHHLRAFPTQHITVATLQRTTTNHTPSRLSRQPLAHLRQPRPAVVVVKRNTTRHLLNIGLRMKIITIAILHPQPLSQQRAHRRLTRPRHTHHNNLHSRAHSATTTFPET